MVKSTVSILKMEAHSFMKREAVISPEVSPVYYQAISRHISEKASLHFCIQLRSKTQSLRQSTPKTKYMCRSLSRTSQPLYR